MAEYEVLEQDLRGYQDGEEVEVEIRDRETLESKPVRAMIYRAADAFPDGEPLWVRALETGVLKEEPWTIKIVAEIPVNDYARNKGGGQ